ncbi:MAG: carbon-nitrogen hydrolase family protein [Planctomycetes bacterium]|nr:carbon-nitrogen hydrolase family protein [Planctomycetota bacterium]
MTTLRIALAQCRQTGSFEANARTIFRFLGMAADAGANIVCFPETQTVGYRVDIATPNTPVEPERLDDLHRRVAERCGESGMACVLGTEMPFPSDPVAGKPYNSALVISPSGAMLGAHHKTRLTPLDAIAYSAGSSFETFDLFGVRVGVVICFEGFRFAETTRECVRQGAQLVFHPQNNTTRPNDWKLPIHEAMIVTRAAENTIWFASCNMCHERHQNCRSTVVAPDGRIHAQAELRQEHLLVADLDIDLATRAMFHFDLEGCAPLLFGDTVDRAEYAAALG